MSETNIKPIVLVIVVGAILGTLILNLEKSDFAEHDNQHTFSDAANEDSAHKEQIGPRGGRIFTADNFSVEITIFEKGVDPQFRLYLYEGDQPIPPDQANVGITLSRLGRSAQLFSFRPVGDYLLGDQVVDEPHSFDIAITAERDGKEFNWGYSQVEARIEMTTDTLTSTGIRIETAGPATIRPNLQLPGIIAFNHHNIVRVVPRAPGIVLEVPRHLGEQISEGTVLAVVESQLLADLRSQYLAAQKRLTLANINFEREKQLWEEKITAKQEYLTTQQLKAEAEIALELAEAKLHAIGDRPEAVSSLKNLTRYEIRSPISGLITTKSVARGQVIKEDTEIFTVVDTSTMYADLTVFPKDLGAIRLGQKAVIKSTATNITGTGEITYISAMLNTQTRTAMARIILDNTSGLWRDGMFVSGNISTEEIEVPVAVYMDGLQTLFDWTVVFGRYGDYFEARPLELGINDGEKVEVLSGLHAGERYASGNSFAVKAELGKSGAEHDH
ncbi:membrane fusion protein, cobalt-zinc-cadmium efflux system [Nitrosomonas marina]|uniref:Membrane fusion protein, cobalt-zinc-cadmium efflux system n=1 Tax=Nitrosomonas marina TaxID=917 RepID=A0A1H9ZHR4_9PROT|nr:efflux RND transporter periplasmic adaptor subunit [Nitrosomonas marina]SES81132.1 membrane fusion protein, cobalt-zinc-cadmium efflux system [Nitrosomonas marina]